MTDTARTIGTASLWVVTSYFNPAKYRQRYENFQTFRKHLSVPLLVVELERNGAFELSSSDADQVIQLTGEDRLWQKENLLNIAISRLPSEVEFVAWVDCDVVFSNPDWPRLTTERLAADSGLVQLFETVHHLTKETTQSAQSLEDLLKAGPFFSQSSFAAGATDRDAFLTARVRERDPNRAKRSTPHPRARIASGIAWAARRAEIDACGLYEGAILGSGDVLLACAMRDWLDGLLDIEYHGGCLRADVNAWAHRLRASVGQSLNVIDNTVCHLWHGDFENRHYRERQTILVEHNYDPSHDIRRAENGTLEWVDPTSALARDVAAYFPMRREDG
ncbi:hypothetical protein [Marivita hallyeonensis]|uniref:Glycosyl transferase family 2 n=1 Tax=Marivita hallyeonensis TaxID=996342 RepID=A0A1M5Y9T2_9RHOB|nr:hypothetical protein [Marivita hallyeonensis]SHI08851.1 hypothetical protein SAMN05443551_0186 [Marivita hallyeonensis]